MSKLVVRLMTEPQANSRIAVMCVSISTGKRFPAFTPRPIRVFDERVDMPTTRFTGPSKLMSAVM